MNRCKDSLLYYSLFLILDLFLKRRGEVIMIKDIFTIIFSEVLSNPSSKLSFEDFYNKALEKGLSKDEALKTAKTLYNFYSRFIKNNI